MSFFSSQSLRPDKSLSWYFFKYWDCTSLFWFELNISASALMIVNKLLLPQLHDGACGWVSVGHSRPACWSANRKSLALWFNHISIVLPKHKGSTVFWNEISESPQRAWGDDSCFLWCARVCACVCLFMYVFVCHLSMCRSKPLLEESMYPYLPTVCCGAQVLLLCLPLRLDAGRWPSHLHQR